MKKAINFFIAMQLTTSFAIAQVSILNNTNPGTGTPFLGWNTLLPGPLQVKNELTDPINFYTTGGAGTFNNLRARIFEDNLLAPNGNVVNVGRVHIREDNATSITLNEIPVSLLHLGHRWNLGTGGHRTWMDVGTYTNAVSDNMYFGLKHEFTPGTQTLWDDHMDAVIGWGDNAAIPDNLNDMRFIFTTPMPLGGVSGSQDGLETMRISYTGNVGIGNFYIAGQPPATNAIRPFRRLEVLDGGRNQPQFRLTHTQQNGVGTGIFTDFQTTLLGDLFINPTDNGTNRRVGINTDVPVRTLEVFENSPDPQLRLTHIISAVPATRRFADFRVSGNGDLIITPTKGNSDGKVGINTTSAPGNTLTIDAGVSSPANSGLQFVQLTSANTPTFVSNNKVLTVDGSGNVVLTNDQGGGNFTSCGGTGTLNHIMKYTNNVGTFGCQAAMQEDLNGFVGIGVGVSPVTNQAMSIGYTNSSAGIANGITIATNSTFGDNSGINLYTGTFDNILYGTYLRSTSDANTMSNSHKYGHFVDLNGNSEYNTGYYSNITGGGNTLYSYGFYGRVTGAVKGANPTNYGVEVEATGTLATYNYGVHGVGDRGKNAIGVHGKGNKGDIESIGVDAVGYGDAGTDVYGVKSIANSPAKNNYGVYGWALNGTNNIGIYGKAATTCTGSGGSLFCSSVAGFFNGDAFATNFYIASDQKFKTNILNASDTWPIIDALQPRTFDYDSTQFPSMNLPVGNHYGLIAQEVELVLPNLIKNLVQPEVKDSTGAIIYPEVSFKAVNYTELIPVMLKAMKEQQEMITNQQTQLDSIKNVLSGSLPRSNSGNKNSSNQQRIELGNNQGIILNQNDPNPFAESTQITYYIPDGIKEVKIMFSDNKGRVLRSAKIETLGEGTLEVYASDLSSGIYTYTLICDGKVIDTKKMVKQ